jgi:hypothetical protein
VARAVDRAVVPEPSMGYMLASSSYSQHGATEHIRVDDWIRSVIALFDVAGQHLKCVPESSTAGGEDDCPLWDGQIIDATLPP